MAGGGRGSRLFWLVLSAFFVVGCGGGEERDAGGGAGGAAGAGSADSAGSAAARPVELLPLARLESGAAATSVAAVDTARVVAAWDFADGASAGWRLGQHAGRAWLRVVTEPDSSAPAPAAAAASTAAAAEVAAAVGSSATAAAESTTFLEVRAPEAGADADAQVHIPVRPGTRYRLRARLRARGLESRARVHGTILVAEFGYVGRGDRNDPLRWHRDWPSLGVELEARRGPEVPAAADPAAATTDWSWLTREFETHPQTRMLRISLVLGNWGRSRGAVQLERLILTELPRSAPAAGAGAGTGGVDRALVGGESRRALRAPAPTRYRIPLRVPAAGARLHLGMGLETSGAIGGCSGAALFEVGWREQPGNAAPDAAGAAREHLPEVLLLRREVAAESCWVDVTIPLERWAGRRGELVLRTLRGQRARSATPAAPASAGARAPRPTPMAAWSGLRLIPSRPAAAVAAPDLFLFTIDTLRPDHLSTYGYPRPTSPALTALAADALRFNQAFTTIPRTSPAVASMLTGLYPRRHGLRDLVTPLPDSITTLAAELAAEGYLTAAFVTKNVAASTGLLVGFDTYRDHAGVAVNSPAGTSDLIVGEALDWLARHRDDKVFLWVHTWDPHFRYRPQDPDDRTFDPDYSGGFDLYDRLDRGALKLGQLYFHSPLSAAEVDHAVSLYDAEIRAGDRALGRLVEALREWRLYDPALLLVSADHGEALGEHAYHFEHGEYLYDETLRIPLVVKFPRGAGAGRVIDAPVSIRDIYATLAAAGRVPNPANLTPGRVSDPQFPGPQSLDRWIAAPLPAPLQSPRTLFAETGRRFFAENPRREVPGIAGRWRAIRRGRWKLIAIPRATGFDYELYDLATDPTELHNRFSASDSLGTALVTLLDDWWQGRLSAGSDRAATVDSPAPAPAEQALTHREQEKLRSLGYLD